MDFKATNITNKTFSNTILELYGQKHKETVPLEFFPCCIEDENKIHQYHIKDKKFSYIKPMSCFLFLHEHEKYGMYINVYFYDRDQDLFTRRLVLNEYHEIDSPVKLAQLNDACKVFFMYICLFEEAKESIEIFNKKYQMNLTKIRKTRGMDVINYIYHSLHKTPMKEILYKAGLEMLAVYSDEFEDLNLLATNPKALFDGVGIKYLKYFNDFHSLKDLRPREEIDYMEEIENMDETERMEYWKSWEEDEYINEIIESNDTPNQHGMDELFKQIMMLKTEENRIFLHNVIRRLGDFILREGINSWQFAYMKEFQWDEKRKYTDEEKLEYKALSQIEYEKQYYRFVTYQTERKELNGLKKYGYNISIPINPLTEETFDFNCKKVDILYGWFIEYESYMERSYNEQKSYHKWFAHIDDDYQICCPDSLQELVNKCFAFHNCSWQCIKNVAKGSVVLLFAKRMQNQCNTSSLDMEDFMFEVEDETVIQAKRPYNQSLSAEEYVHLEKYCQEKALNIADKL